MNYEDATGFDIVRGRQKENCLRVSTTKWTK